MNSREITLIGPEGTNLFVFFQFLIFNLISWFNLYLLENTLEFNLNNVVFRQIIFSLLGVAVFFLFTYISINNIYNLSEVLLFSSTVLLFGVLFTQESLGARRRYDLGIIDVQPSEFTKIILVIVIAKFLAESSKNIWIIAGVIANVLLIFLQPDLGTTLILLILIFVLMFISSTRIIFLVTSLISSFFGFLALLELNLVNRFQVKRITDFYSDIQDFSQTQARLQISLGGLTGQSIDENISIFVPVQTTDFIFSAFSKNFGFLGNIMLFSLWVLFALRVRRLILKSDYVFEKFLLSGLIMLFFIQIFINVFTVLGLIPLTGDPFPLLSLGGSSILATSAAFGIINRSFIENNLTI